MHAAHTSNSAKCHERKSQENKAIAGKRKSHTHTHKSLFLSKKRALNENKFIEKLLAGNIKLMLCNISEQDKCNTNHDNLLHSQLIIAFH